jgi:site-specific DNA-methyltransferase (adenine-specific)
MKPYYGPHAGISIYHGDCRDVLPTLAPASLDLILADPNYGETSLEWDIRDLSWLRLATPALKPTGSVWCFGSMRSFMDQAAEIFSLGWRLAQDVVWEKHNGSGFAADRFRRVHEVAVQLYRAETPWTQIWKSPVMTLDATARHIPRTRGPTHTGDIGASEYRSKAGGPRLMRSVIKVRSCHHEAVHPTQKPLGILDPLIRYSCPPGGLVLDPTMGSGSTLVAAKQLGRRAIGIEISEEQCAHGARRCTQEMLFAAVV